MRTLVVEDNEDSFRFLQLVLRNAGHLVSIARNGEEALEVARRLPPDLTISDILMPVMDGFTLCRAWQEDPRLRESPLVFYTATYTSEEDDSFALSLGARAFIRKPMDPIEFLARVDSALLEVAEAPAAPPPREPTEPTEFHRLYNERLIQKLDQRHQALAESERRFRATFEQGAAGLAIRGTDGRFEKVNARFAEMLGTDPETLVGRFEADVIHPDDLEADETARRLLHEDEQAPSSREKRYLRPDGSAVWTQVSTSLVRNAAGAPACFLVAAQDITERKEAETRLKALNDELEERVAERTAALEAANRELESFASAVSHDLRAPLRGIDGRSGVLLEDFGERLGEEGCRQVEAIRSAVTRMARLVDSLLALSRAGRGPLARERVDLGTLAREEEARLREAEPGRDVELSVAPGLVAEGDPVLLRAVVQNLVGNAWKFTGRRDHARIEVGATILDDERTFYVADNGTGFPPAESERLFQPFQRLHGRDEFPGAGIGLATVERIVRRHGGRVRARGEEDRGATIYFTLPDSPGPGSPGGSKAEAKAGAKSSADRLQGADSHPGRQSVKVAPRPGDPSAATHPPWRRAIRSTTASPIPVPSNSSGRWSRWNGRKSWPACAGSNPTPSSRKTIAP